MQAQKITTKSKSSFLSSFSILPKQKRDDIYIVYAWCRQADDIADDKGAPDDKLKRLNIFKSNFTRALTGRQSDELNTRAPKLSAVTVFRKTIFTISSAEWKWISTVFAPKPWKT
jgi:phytoene/squalene synthetase